MPNKKALITGATSGIGLATARILADNNYDVIICGRRKERLEELASELSGKVNVQMLSFDVSDKKDVKAAFESLDSEWRTIDVLINNAGNAHGLSPLNEGDIEDWDAMMDINVKGLLYVSNEVIPEMVKSKKGHIVNIGSIAGKEVYPNGNVYCASKHAVDAINKGMLIDLNQHNIKVTAINPGLVETEFSQVRFKGDKERAEKVYKGFDPLMAKDIAETIYFVVSRPAHVKICDLTIFPTAQASATIVNKSE
ncbi:SDR family NAD(P)-dependent oxidoreductase [Fulvivirga sediminis]|uniref:SDR family NAD(P)-dependent oxidoreductase n=1 Tax=Fulvivirga sediminis TaxID=2803949 RepID=A0A937JZA4_9BACT|nr:SDR family NAD(P)-dependent oxidoreductase [Fulvivirga sediminis]MBL3656469.1 SDR family NAD(P)-dependent oxidoreductase [Fulvivirga sediminis]